MHIDGDRLWANLIELSQIGKGEHGISRLAFTPADMEGRIWLFGKMRDAGLEMHMDAVGNVFGRLDPVPGPSDAPRGQGACGRAQAARLRAPAILLGSHIDTVPEGGMFDGVLGVLGGLECLETIRESGCLLNHPVELVAFSNEEGSRIMPGTFGSRAFAHGVSQDEWARVFPFLAESGLAESGLAGLAPAASLNPEDYLSYLELHIEQGGVLDTAGEDIGVVQGIVSIASFNVVFRGESNHAGTTPMGHRRDALLGAAELILAVPRAVKELGSPDSVGTCGQISVRPGGRNVIPGEANISIESRDLDGDLALRIASGIGDEAVAIAGRRGLQVEVSPVSLNAGALMDPRIQDIVHAAARGLGLSVRRMPSGAGHDAMNLATRVPTGMVFVPSRGGVSHSPKEYTSKDHCAAGASVLLQTILRIDAEGLSETQV